MTVAQLPLFRNAELSRLQQRREALLKRVQHMPAYTPGRPLALYKLQQLTAEVIRLEIELRRRR
jgi:hypothetical protein